MSALEEEYYSSHNKLNFIGNAGQSILRASAVLVVGAGGLGCPCLLNLATSGIGTIGIADFDTVSTSNLHRQTLFGFDDIGKYKTEVAMAQLPAHNPFIKLCEHRVLVDEANILELVEKYDLVVDCTDNFRVRYLLNDVCVYLNKPLVYGAIHQTEGNITVFNYLGSGTLRCLFPLIDTGVMQSCADIGAYNITVSVVGSMMAGEVLKVLLNHADVFADRLVHIDLLAGSLRSIKYRLMPESLEISKKRFGKIERPLSISPAEYFKNFDDKPHILIDVRYEYEHEQFNIGGRNIPLDDLLEMEAIPGIYTTDSVIIYCQQGNRSLEAVKFLRRAGFLNSFNLSGGLSSAKNYG